MKVTGQSPNIAKELTTGQTKNKEGTGDLHNKAETAKNDSVKTSAFTLNKIKEKIAVEPEVRQERVEALKAQIQKGEYQVDVQGLAGKMLTESLQDDVEKS